MSMMPRQLGKYQLLQPLGRGTAGEVWKGTDLQLHQDVALKLIHTDLQSDPHFLTHFIEQGQTLTSLHHANIVPVREVNVIRSSQGNEMTAYLSMDYIEGQILSEYLHQTSHRGAFPPIEQIVYLFTSLGVAIDYAHQHGIVHGNIKPGNILLQASDKKQFSAGEPMLVDFGLAQLLGGANIVGTPQYMSPEQARGEPANNRSDIYALGVLLYEFCTGIQPFRDGSSVAVMMQHINMLPTPPTLINPNVPPALSDVILRAMSKDTANRYAMASLLAAALADACSIQNQFPIFFKTDTTDTANSYQIPSARTTTSILGVPQAPARLSASTGLQPIPAFPQLPPVFTGKHASFPVAAPRPAPIPEQFISDGQPPLPIMQNKAGNTLTSFPTLPIVQSPPTLPDMSAKFPAIQSSSSPLVRQDVGRGEAFTNNFSISYAQTQPPLPPQLSPLSQPPVPISMSPTLQKVRIRSRKKDRQIYIAIASLLVLLLVVSGIIAASLSGLLRGKTANINSDGLSGQVFFQDDALAHNDVLRMDLKNVAPPPAGKSYFAWLQDTAKKNYPLGPLVLTNGNATLLFPGEATHTNLLSTVQAIFITLEKSGPQPPMPGQQRVYQAIFDPGTYPPVKSLLTQDPAFPHDASVVSGMFETIKSMNDKAGSIADSLGNTGDIDLARRQATRIIEMVEGTAYAQSSGDLPSQYSSQLPTKIGLLSTPKQIGYLDTLSKQLDQIASVSANDQMIMQQVQNARYAVSDLNVWLHTIHDNTVTILKTSNLKNNPAILAVALQLKQTAADSYTGRTIPPNASPLPIAGSAGAAQAYTECQYMATLDLQLVRS